MIDSVVVDARAYRSQRLPWRWHNRSVTKYEGRVGELLSLLPTFQRRRRPRGEHEIVWTGSATGGPEIVVGRVSAQYVLVQHQEFLSALPDVLSEEGYEWNNVDGELSLTTYGERMELVIDLPSQGAAPPDGYPLVCRLRCVNSVDRSTALEAELQWYRQICNNGMFGWAGERVRRIHRFDGVVRQIQKQLRRRFKELPNDRLHFSQLVATPVRATELRDWSDVFVARRWGNADAARVLHICMTGRDGVVCAAWDDERSAHELHVEETAEVPGACAPVGNVYHIGQVLSWVAGQADALHTRFSRTSQIPALLQHLLN